MENNWMFEDIKKVFTKCYGLQDCLSSIDNMTVKAAIDTLAIRTGFTKQFIKGNLEPIKNLK